MSLLLLLKLLVVLAFLVMFIRRPTIAWGIGLLTVTTAVLLDTILGTFGREQTQEDLGFFFYIITGALFGGGAFWLWSVLRSASGQTTAVSPTTTPSPPPLKNIDPQVGTAYSQSASGRNQSTTAFDRQMLYDEIRQRFSHEDILDLVFDLGINENDIMSVGQETTDLIRRLMDFAEDHELLGALALGVERILTPPPPDHLPRAEKLDVTSPPTILRQYLLARYTLIQLEQMSSELGVDWEQLTAGSKKTKVRSLLQYLYRRNRIDDLVALIRH
ncbi:MAG: hypothetical protein KC423_22295 [Anaerolineales bacterium]|nr:hypothetical protein [Anaerolineales bacterium]